MALHAFPQRDMDTHAHTHRRAFVSVLPAGVLSAPPRVMSSVYRLRIGCVGGCVCQSWLVWQLHVVRLSLIERPVQDFLLFVVTRPWHVENMRKKLSAYVFVGYRSNGTRERERTACITSVYRQENPQSMDVFIECKRKVFMWYRWLEFLLLPFVLFIC